MKLSVGLITYNEEKNLPRTLDSIIEIANEIIIVDSGSTDKTVEIAKKYNANVYSENWKGYGLQKNSVIDKCTGEWILLIDADEEVSEELREEIKKKLSFNTDTKAFKMYSHAICFGKLIKYGGWSSRYKTKLFKKECGRYDNVKVHERFITTEKVGIINGCLYHHTYDDINGYLEKFNRYTSEAAEEYRKKEKRKSFILFFLNSYFMFIKMYIFKLGFLDGYEGYLLAKLSSLYVFIKYAKLKELNRRNLWK